MSKRSLKIAVFVALFIVLGRGTVEAQFNGHNSLGDFGLLSGSQPAPGFYAAAFYYRYGTDLVRNRDGDQVGFDLSDPSELTVLGNCRLQEEHR